MFKILENSKIKICRSKDYNWDFYKDTGYFQRWGNTKADDPEMAPGPEILDIEISTICNGIPNSGPCKFCYKQNTSKGINMSFEIFKKIFSKFPKTLTQIAFGIGNIFSNKDLYKIMQYCRNNGVIPNITINGAYMKDSDYENLCMICGAVAVSHYDDDICFNAIKNLSLTRNKLIAENKEPTLKQINIHKLLSEDTIADCYSLIDKYQTDNRLEDLNACVFLLMKPKGKRNNYTQIKDHKKYQALVDYAFAKKMPIGFDSCSAPHFIRSILNKPNSAKLIECAEPCESTLFSLYINVEGKAYPCSFCEEKNIGIDLLKIDNFILDVWNNQEIKEFRNKLLSNIDNNNCRNCPVFDLTME